MWHFIACVALLKLVSPKVSSSNRFFTHRHMFYALKFDKNMFYAVISRYVVRRGGNRRNERNIETSIALDCRASMGREIKSLTANAIEKPFAEWNVDIDSESARFDNDLNSLVRGFKGCEHVAISFMCSEAPHTKEPSAAHCSLHRSLMIYVKMLLVPYFP